MSVLEGNGDRYVTWKQTLMFSLPTIVTIAIGLIAISAYMDNSVRDRLESHRQTSAHQGAVGVREFSQVKSDLEELKLDIREIRALLVESLREEKKK